MRPLILKTVRLGTCYLLSVALAAAASFEINLAYASLALKNGRTLTDVQIKSFDFDTGNVILTTGRNLHSLQIEMLPDEVAAKIASLVPEESKAQARAAKAKREQASREQSRSRQISAQSSRAQAQRNAAAQSHAQQEQTAARDRARLIARTKQLAFNKADHYFRYEYKPGSGSTVTIRQGVTLDEPEEISGWPGRCRVTGRVGLQFYDSRGRSFSHTNREFEVTIQRNSKGVEEVVDFTLK